MTFVIIHGAFGSPGENWFPQLRRELEALGQKVLVPQFPVDSWEDLKRAGPEYTISNQTLPNWLSVFEQVKEAIPKNEKLCFVGHSLGPLFILHAVDRFSLKLDSAIFVSPFLDKLDSWEINLANASFYKTDFDFEHLKKLIPVSYVLYSDNDPYVAKQHSLLFAKALDSSPILVRRAGHMNSAVNLNEFPLVLDLCLTRLDLSLYQRYLAHRKKIDAQAYIMEEKDRGRITLRPGDVVDEGLFHFTHLSKQGFCTLYAPLADYWDPDSIYMQKAREAAARVRDFTRVIIFDKTEELVQEKIRKQIRLDLQAGIRIFVIPYESIRSQVPEPDFGIWDNEYVCIVRSDRVKHRVTEVELTSRQDDISDALGWKQTIMEKATPINDPETDTAGYIGNLSV
ncbi:hypothetical protein A2Z33_05375 [Candidatus Gottesmanbacteria bacterium RBG_16_52_11]|uniref:AB hydrolase-1 domain-containing protein n=1 Tax=Candidatus Gottesmanbacteria bacterium RBG_16_52_11 TaxID=1798374 RepID=A0A1F5YME3_9BACT|nr:MAG: hypothetical protein A2Z33_05375 [Candidatus Gottesmanbacteria bacterium RBG_16_52_11]